MSTPQPEKSHLIDFLSKFPSLTDEKVLELAELIPVIAPKKGTVLLKEGQVPKGCYFVLQGLVRQYQYIDGVERTTEFYTEQNGAVSSAHYTDQTPSSFYLECMEDCLLISGKYRDGRGAFSTVSRVGRNNQKHA